MISVKYLHQVQVALLSGFINLGLVKGFIGIWLHAWMVAYAIAFPTILIVFPFARKLAMKIASKG
jgi:hypothetical protein